MNFAFPSAIGKPTPALSAQTVKRLRSEQNDAEDKASFWNSLTAKSAVGGLTSTSTGAFLMATLPAAFGALPVVPVALLVAGVSLAISAGIGALRSRALIKKSEEIDQRVAYIESTGAAHGVSAPEKINVAGFMGRLAARRQTPDAAPRQAPVFGKKQASRM